MTYCFHLRYGDNGYSMIGIDISDRSIKIASVTSGSSREFRTVCWSPLEPDLIKRGIIQDVPKLVQELQKTCTKCSPFPVEGKDVVVSIPERQSFVRVLDLPLMSDAEIDEAVGWAIRKDLPFDLDRVYLDWQPIAGATSANIRQVVVGAAQKEVVDPLLAALDGAGFIVKALELEAQAMVRSLLPIDALSVEGVAICDLGATTTKVIYFDKGSMRFTLALPTGGDQLTATLVEKFGLSPEAALEKKSIIGILAREGNDGEIAYALREAVLSLLTQVQSGIQSALSQLSATSGLRGILLSGGGANLPGIRDAFSEVFPGIPVDVGNPLINLSSVGKRGTVAVTPQDASHFVTAIGLALRHNTL